MGSTKPEKKEKKEKKRSEADGVGKVKKDKKDKKDKKEKLKTAVTAALEEQEEPVDAPATVIEEEKKKKTTTTTDVAATAPVAAAPIVGALVPFARPLADEKATKKVMKSVRKGMDLFFFFSLLSLFSYRILIPSLQFSTLNSQLSIHNPLTPQNNHTHQKLKNHPPCFLPSMAN